MKYMGSKSKIANKIISVILEHAESSKYKIWVEPFVGGANVIKNVPSEFERLGYDKNYYLIEMYKFLQSNGFSYTEDIPKSLYNSVREAYNNNSQIVDGKEVNPSFIGWIGFMASANGRFFDGGYSGISNTKLGTQRNYIDESIRGLKKEFPLLKNISFESSDYQSLNFENAIIYCDPPYKGTKTYNTSKNFNHEVFYNWCRQQSKKNLVFVSEYNMPSDFICIWEQEVKSSLSANGICGGSKKSIEKLFKIDTLRSKDAL